MARRATGGGASERLGICCRKMDECSWVLVWHWGGVGQRPVPMVRVREWKRRPPFGPAPKLTKRCKAAIWDLHLSGLTKALRWRVEPVEGLGQAYSLMFMRG